MLPDKVAQMLRGQALGWLRADLARYAGDPAGKEMVLARLGHWLREGDFASVRDDKALLSLPDNELLRWRKLWQDVAALLKQAEAKE